MKIAVIGAGKMGLPLACQMATNGARVFACDVNPGVVTMINHGRSPIDEPGVQELLEKAVEAGSLSATTDTAATVREVDACIVIVPALLTEDFHAELSILRAVNEKIVEGMHDGLLVCYETTVPVGTVRNEFVADLEKSGKTAGLDFFVAFSPERVKSQLVLQRLTKTPKIVGGIDEESARRAEEMYGRYLGAEVINVETVENAEMVKLAGMIYRDINIAVVNELARYAEVKGIDLTMLIDAINTNGEAHLLQPGIGVGGHCAPVYPYFMIHDARESGVPVELAEKARAINDGQAEHVVRRLAGHLGSLDGRRAMILGLGFRPGVKEYFCSTAFLLQPHLMEAGAEVVLHDPLYTDEEIEKAGFAPGRLDGESLPEVLVLNTAHGEYMELDFDQLAQRGVKAVIDGRNVWNPRAVRAAGIEYLGIGRTV